MSAYNNSNTPDYGLKQGVSYEDTQDKVISMRSHVNLERLEQTTTPELGSIIEGLENRTIESENSEITQHMKDLENQFNSKLAEYTNLYRTYLQQLTSEDELLSKWKGKNVYYNPDNIDSADKFNYVNKFGYTRSWPRDAWYKLSDEGSASNCPRTSPSKETASVYTQLQHGSPMGIGEPCDLEGSNIRDTDTDKLYWLDSTGTLHLYPDQETWDATQKNGGCSSSYVSLPTSVISTMAIGSPMNSLSKCDTLHLNNALWKRITALNHELIEISDKMYNTIYQIDVKDDKVSKEVAKVREDLRQRIQELNGEREKLEHAEQRVATLKGEFQNTELNATREYVHYLAWTLSAITLGALAFKYMIHK